MRCVSRTLAVVTALLATACDTTQVDTSDRQAFFFEGRVWKELEGADEKSSPHIEGAWTRADGSVSELDYTINTIHGGFGMAGTVSEDGWAGVAGGLSLQHIALDSDVEDIEGDDTGVGPYAVLEGGWRATEVLEPCARAELALYFPDLSSMFAFEVGARFHVIEYAALFLGWRYTLYNIRDVTSGTSVEEIELDASGLVLGLHLDF